MFNKLLIKYKGNSQAFSWLWENGRAQLQALPVKQKQNKGGNDLENPVLEKL